MMLIGTIYGCLGDYLNILRSGFGHGDFSWLIVQLK